jgi:hypothetical protein
MTEDDARQLFLAAHPQFTEDDFKNPGWVLVDAIGAWADALAEIRMLEEPDLAFLPRLPGESLSEFRLRTGLQSDK